MAVLSEVQRRSLEKAVERAREVAEAGARSAIKQLGVQAPEQLPHLSPEERDLRNRLRARARQLGDTRNARTGEHAVDHLVVECAYEHWHRMLFARFLAENNVLMHPDGVPVTLDECEELAQDEGAADGWELAAWYAAEMLPQIFRPGSPIFELKLPPEKVRDLERLLADLPPAVFTASDSLGWVYQFWQAKKKNEVNQSQVKIGADELPAVTQLFTEPYMVQFLLQNTLGAWWAGRHGRSALPLEMEYLRLLEDGTPAAGPFDGWPKTTCELRVLDPCCGSGHFLVAAFDILVRFQMSEEGCSPADACAAVLRDNLHGLEIDERCTQIAAFALALAAWTFPGAGGYRVLPEMHIACSGIAPRAEKDEWLALAGDDHRLRNGMERLFHLFQDAPILGSIIDPTGVDADGQQRALGVARFDELRPLLAQKLRTEDARAAKGQELGIAAQGIAAAAELLAEHYTIVMTNVPYLGLRRMAQELKDHCELNHREARHDLANVVLDRSIRLTARGGCVAVVTPQAWFFASSFNAFRKRWLKRYAWNVLARLGSGAFDAITGEVVNVALLAVTNVLPQRDRQFAGLDCEGVPRGASRKAAALTESDVRLVSQAKQLTHPDQRILFSQQAEHPLLNEVAVSLAGIQNGDSPRYQRKVWELLMPSRRWVFEQTVANGTNHFSGLDTVLDFDKEEGHLRAPASWRRQALHDSDQRGKPVWGQRGVLVSRMSSLPCTLYLGDPFDQASAVIVPRNQSLVPAVWAFCSSPEFGAAVRRIDKKLNVTSATLAKVPFDVARWQQIAAERYPDGLPEAHSDDPTQWIFKGSVHPSTEPLQVAVARLLGHRWPEQQNDGLDDLIDDDGIVCLSAVRGEEPAAVRVRRILARAFGSSWSPHRLGELLESVGCKGWPLERWLDERFFQQHCAVFQNRPFIWHIWDGLKKGGFGAFVNYHKLDRKLLDTLTYNYLGDWIRRQEDGAKRGEEGADDRLLAARSLQDKLKLVLEGEPPCDIFVRWKPLERQPVGWEPDIDDGVRMNIRPFMLAGDVGKKGAGILRDKPNINWGKDRGKDPADAYWHDEFGGDRINDHHLTLAEKKTARDAAGDGA